MNPGAFGPEPFPLGTELHHDLTLMPCTPAPSAAVPYRMGGYTREGDALEALMLHRLWGPCERALPVLAQRVRAGCHLYGGMMFGHFGHFLLESLSRVWALKQWPDVPVVWHAMGGSYTLRAWQHEVFALLGVDTARFHYVDVPLRLEQLRIPAPGYVIPHWAHPEQLSALGVYEFGEPQPGCRIWLSRSALPDSLGRVEGELPLEQRLAAAGWQIVHPEQLSLAEQLGVLSRAERILGFVGSAFHVLMLGRAVRARVGIIQRDNGLSPSPNYLTQALGKGYQQDVFQIGLRHVAGRGAAAHFTITDVDAAFRQLAAWS